MATLTAARVSVTTSATALNAAATTQHPSDMQSVLVKNLDASASVDVGPSTVTSGAGYPLAAGESVSMDLSGTGAIVYAIAGSGTVSVAVVVVNK